MKSTCRPYAESIPITTIPQHGAIEFTDPKALARGPHGLLHRVATVSGSLRDAYSYVYAKYLPLGVLLRVPFQSARLTGRRCCRPTRTFDSRSRPSTVSPLPLQSISIGDTSQSGLSNGGLGIGLGFIFWFCDFKALLLRERVVVGETIKITWPLLSFLRLNDPFTFDLSL